MKKMNLFRRSVFTIVLLAISAIVTMAQTNPKPGYVIKNNGDTIRGNIDFRTNEKLSKQCVFWADGGSGGMTYKPGDIEGFRFDNGGKYFVTRRLNVKPITRQQLNQVYIRVYLIRMVQRLAI